MLVEGVRTYYQPSKWLVIYALTETQKGILRGPSRNRPKSRLGVTLPVKLAALKRHSGLLSQNPRPAFLRGLNAIFPTR